ncbi:HPr family phosphocarrier protein [Streptomyces sp. BE20]|uniref:HPr family phosphocarrier protein n=1 Tax=unclassified Streptomyces TaxID=2593676 RepID=UPI002E75AE11|nr:MULTISPECIES: HPr family phosphocarrier protein [unclassified Streptomyces]MED7948819.1 HPr family phosphocarrier protein [Streptomyces sp. BE303]MEE1821308.1 HPr family phosphocarrier protein [Streptomyces sp. BE20]
MPRLLATVGSRNGLHARPASLFVQAAARHPVKVSVGKPGGTPVDARSLLSVLALAARHGETLELHAEGDQAQDALEELAGLLATDLDTT